MSHKRYAYIITEVHIRNIKVGDTIICKEDNAFRTVCKNNLSYCSFLGYGLFGSSYNGGSILVKRVDFVTRDKAKYLSDWSKHDEKNLIVK